MVLGLKSKDELKNINLRKSIVADSHNFLYNIDHKSPINAARQNPPKFDKVNYEFNSHNIVPNTNNMPVRKVSDEILNKKNEPSRESIPRKSVKLNLKDFYVSSNQIDNDPMIPPSSNDPANEMYKSFDFDFNESVQKVTIGKNDVNNRYTEGIPEENDSE